MAIASAESFADRSHAGIIERHMLCVQSPMNLAESADPSSSSQFQSSMNFGSRN